MRVRLLTAATLALVTSLAVPAAAAAPCTGLPQHNGLPVVDAANVLEPQKRAYLTGDLMRFTMTSDVAVVAATVPTLSGDDVASYAKRLFDCWGIGDSESDRGVLILAAMRERRLRVELGRGLAGEIGEQQLTDAVDAMTAPMRRGDVAGALRAAAVKVAEALGEELPDLERFAATNGKEGLGDLGIPENVIDATAPPGFPFDEDDLPSGANPFRHSPIGDASWIPKLVIPIVVVGVITTIGRALRGGLGGGSTWRGGFPVFGGSRSGWDDPNLLNNGQWSQGTWVGPSDSGSDSPSFASSSSGSSGSSGGGSSSFGGGSSGGGGASGSW